MPTMTPPLLYYYYYYSVLNFVFSFQRTNKKSKLIFLPFTPLFFLCFSVLPFSNFLVLGQNSADIMSLDLVRTSLIRQEDTIIFNLIERAKFPRNSALYNKTFFESPMRCNSLIECIVKETEGLQSKVGRYDSPEEHPFFPDNLPPSLMPSRNQSQVLHPAASSININSKIWDIYFNQLLPLFTVEGDDENYALTAVSDLQCLQALSRRIHYGKFVAEVKFKDSPNDYSPLIRAKDTDALMKLLTDETVEEMVKQRVEKKAEMFGQEVTLGENDDNKKYKVDPSVVSRLYGEWVIPLTKVVEVEYLLKRLDNEMELKNKTKKPHC